MNRTSILSFAVTTVGIAALLAGTVHSQHGAPKNVVALQASSPGVSQSGHLNISGFVMASRLFGNGSNVTSVNATLLDGLDSTDFLQALPSPLVLSDAVGATGVMQSTNSNAAANSCAVWGKTTALTGVTYGGHFISDSTSGQGIHGFASSVSGSTFGGFFESMSPGGTGIKALSAGALGVVGSSTSTGGTTYGGKFDAVSTAGRGVYGRATSSTGLTYGGEFVVDSPDGTGVYANSAGTYGVYGRSNRTGTGYGGYFTNAANSGSAIYVEALGSSGTGGTIVAPNNGLNVTSSRTNGTGNGGNFETNAPAGAAVKGNAMSTADGLAYGGWFSSSTNGGTGVFASVTSPFATGYAADFEVNSPLAVGLRAENFATTGTSYGLISVTNSPSGIGMLGYVDGDLSTTPNTGGRFGSNTVNGRGVLGIVTVGSASDSPYGVMGQANTTSLGYGVFATGDMGASGVKSFRIDHPDDPANKYLLHYSSESPFPQNFYSGNAVTDEKGYAWVELPQYFSQINTNIKYQLTVVDDADSSEFVQVKVSKKVAGSRFQIRSSAPNVEVSWRIEADRDDLRIRANRPTDIREKSVSEKGKYQHPEYYGLSSELGLNQLLPHDYPRTSPKRKPNKR